MTPALHEILKLDTWKLGLAAWVFAGYSPLHLKSSGKLIRLTDSAEISDGSQDFREAEKLREEILSLLVKNFSKQLGRKIDATKEQLPRNAIISEVTNTWGKEERIHIWWLDLAIELQYIPPAVKPSQKNTEQAND